MENNISKQLIEVQNDEDIQNQIEASLKGRKKKKYIRFVLAALSSIPWVGGLISAFSSFSADKDQSQVNELNVQWFKEHENKLKILSKSIYEIMYRIELLGDDAENRIEGNEYLELVRQGYKVWDNSSTNEKRKFIQHLLSNAAGTTLCSDDVVRLFIEWIDKYHEMHFAVIREIYKNPGITRAEIWDTIRGIRPRDNSAEADLFRLLIRDLSTGGIIRQHRPTNDYGQYLAKGRASRKAKQTTLKTPFDDIEPYELTELGNQFVHYTMEDVVPRIGTNK